MPSNLINALSDTALAELLATALDIWQNGRCCPNNCSVKRSFGAEGLLPPCGGYAHGIKVASFAVHDGEEPPISGWNGAGNIFFSGCTMKCIFCQNWPISHELNGRLYRYDEFWAETLKMLQKKVHNINLTTSDHYLYPVLKVLADHRSEIKVPVSYNCSGYFTEESLEVVRKFADIFLYDVKYLDPALAARYSQAPRYVEAMKMGMVRLDKERIPWLEDDLGLLRRGLIVRHLVVPGAVQNSLAILDWLAQYRDAGLSFHLSLMSQYFPAYKAVHHPEINRLLTHEEYDPVAERMAELGLDGWIQDLDAEGGA